MPNKRTAKSRSVKSLQDVTLNDFANSAVCNNRPKKSTSNVTKVLKTFEEEKTWDEKVDEFEGDFVEEIDEDGNITYVIKKTETRRRRKTISTSEGVNNVGNDYPIDIWFLISEYISPESIGCFAAICKTSFEVTCTAKFWFNLYRRYYVSAANLPEELQPECLVRKYRLKTSVIRALHYMYPPFVNKIKSVALTSRKHPEILRKRLCQSHWFQKTKLKKQWIFYFKMREKTAGKMSHFVKSENNLPDLLEVLDDVSANADEHCRVLQVICEHFIQIPPVLGLVLLSVSVSLSHCYRYDKVQLSFGTGMTDTCPTVVILDPVISYRVLDWWHPLYPHNNHIQDLLGLE